MSNSDKIDKMGILEIVSEIRQKMNSSSSPLEAKNGSGWTFSGSELRFCYFRERVCNFSLRSRTIEPSDFDRVRRKVVLRGEGNTWAPVSWSFDKLHEVGVLSYLFYLLFKCFVNV